MLRLSNIRIGTKLAVTSGIGILLVLGMVIFSMHGNSSVKSATEAALFQQNLARDLIDAKASIRGMQIGVRDVRLASSSENLQAALKYIDTRQSSAIKFIEPNLPKLRIPENRERLQKVRALIDQYSNGAKEIAALKAEVIALEARSGTDSAGRITELNQQAVRFARERTLPIAAEMEDLINKTSDVAKQVAANEEAAAAQELTSAERIGIGIGATVIFVLIGSAFFGAFSIARPLGKMASVLNDLSNDRIVDVPYANRGDEVGGIAKATELFKESIAGKVINLRVRAALDVCKTNVMMADENYVITYMNKTMIEMLREAEADLRKEIPTLDTSKLIGTCIDVFHKNPAHQRRILDNLTSTIETDITVSGLSFHLVVTPIKDAHGKRAGTTVEWQNITKIKAIEEAAFRVRSALDTCATNVMVADENYNIIYMNQTMMDMMRANEANLRKVLPNLDTKRMIGTCIDVFHKNPAHQRGILDKLTSTIQTDLTLSGLNFHLVVTPISDKNGRRLGTTVEWKDETAEKAVETEVNGIVQAALAGDFSQRLPLEGKKGFMLNLATAMNNLCENTAKALQD